jgi:hypothetical protein
MATCITCAALGAWPARAVGAAARPGLLVSGAAVLAAGPWVVQSFHAFLDVYFILVIL